LNLRPPGPQPTGSGAAQAWGPGTKGSNPSEGVAVRLILFPNLFPERVPLRRHASSVPSEAIRNCPRRWRHRRESCTWRLTVAAPGPAATWDVPVALGGRRFPHARSASTAQSATASPIGATNVESSRVNRTRGRLRRRNILGFVVRWRRDHIPSVSRSGQVVRGPEGWQAADGDRQCLVGNYPTPPGRTGATIADAMDSGRRQ
jgi:hypothetical protein